MGERLDIFLNNTYSIGRERAKELIKNQMVLVNGKIISKCSYQILESDKIQISDDIELNKYVSRGGYKLEMAIDKFNIDVKDKKCLDIGASTGGFTHCLLKNGAKEVYAVDTGTDQLHEMLRENKQVISMEKTNILNLTNSQIGDDFQIVTVDVAFVSIKKIIPVIPNFLKTGGHGVLLIKPQFEAGKEYLNKKGVVKDLKIHKLIINQIKEVVKDNKMECLELIQSPIKGHEGNVEYLLNIKIGD